MCVFFQILVLIFTDVCGKSLRRKNGDAHKGIQNVTMRIVMCIVTCLKYRNTYRETNSVSLHPYYVDTSAGGLLVTRGIIRPVVSVLALT